jgi:2-aminoadipate transaminase
VAGGRLLKRGGNVIQNIDKLYSSNTAGMKHSFIREILKLTIGDSGMISFAGGLPNPKSFPRETLAGIFEQVVREEGELALQYGPSEGDKLFKKVLKEFEEEPDLLDEEIMITVGSTNGIYYFTKTFIDPGDCIVCEAPSFPGSLAAMEACGARMFGVEMDELGMVPEELRSMLVQLRSSNEPVKFIYLIPEFQNPTGRTMDLERRRAIVAVAAEFGLPVLEDQPYRELRFSGQRIITLWELGRTEFNDPKLVTIAKSFSKILDPAGNRPVYRTGIYAQSDQAYHRPVPPPP